MHILMKNKEWAKYVQDNRKSQNLTRRKLADLANIDPSYVTLIERDGYVPRKNKVIDIANALKADVDHALLIAGYAPTTIKVDELLDSVYAIKTERMLHTNLRRSINKLFDLTESQQLKVAEMLDAYVHTIQVSKQKSTSNRTVRKGIATA